MFVRQLSKLMAVEYAQSSSHEDEEGEERGKGSKKDLRRKDDTVANARRNSAWMR